MTQEKRASGLAYWLGWLFTGAQQRAYRFKDLFGMGDRGSKLEYNLSEILKKDQDEVLEWAQSLTGEEENFEILVRELIDVFSDDRSYIDQKLSSLYAVQCIEPAVWSMKVNFDLAKELMRALMVLIWNDIYGKVGELAECALPVLMNVTRNFLQQKRVQ